MSKQNRLQSYLYDWSLFCFDIDSRTWRRCQPLGAARIGLHEYAVTGAFIEVIGSSAFLFGGEWSRDDYTAEESRHVPADYSPWFVLDLGLTLKGFCVQELLKNEDLDISKLPPGLRRNFIQQGAPSNRRSEVAERCANRNSNCSILRSF